MTLTHQGKASFQSRQRARQTHAGTLGRRQPFRNAKQRRRKFRLSSKKSKSPQGGLGLPKQKETCCKDCLPSSRDQAISSACSKIQHSPGGGGTRSDSFRTPPLYFHLPRNPHTGQHKMLQSPSIAGPHKEKNSQKEISIHSRNQALRSLPLGIKIIGNAEEKWALNLALEDLTQ